MKKLYLFFLSMICVAASAFAGEYTIVFKDNGTGKGDNNIAFKASDEIAAVVTEGAQYLSSIKAATNAYPGKDGYGIKIGKSGAGGSIELNLSDAGAKKITKVVATAAMNRTDKAVALTINDADAHDMSSTDFAEFTFNFAPTEANTTIKIASSKERLYVTKLVVTYAEDGEVVVPAPTIKMAAENFVEISAEEGATVYYTLDGTEPTEMEGTPYNGAIKINAAVTVKAIAVKDGASSAVASFEAYLNYVSSIAELLDLNDTAHTLTLGGPLTVIYHNGQNTFVTDGEEYFLLFDKSQAVLNQDMENGTVLASATGTYTKYLETIPEMNVTAVGETSTGDAVDAVVMTVADLKASGVSKLNWFVKLEGVTIDADLNLTQGDDFIKGYNKFGLTLPTETEGKTFNVEGFVSYYGGNLQIYIVNATEVVPVAKYAVTFAEAENGTFTVMNGETAIASGDEVEENTELTVNATPADGYELGTITVNGTALTGNTFTVTEAATIAVTFNKVVPPAPEYTAPSGTAYADNYLTAITSTGAQENIGYTASANPGIYNVLENAIAVVPGSEFNINFVANSLGEGSQSVVREDIRFTAAYIFADWYGTGEFSLVEKIGKTAPTHNVYGNYDEVMNINQAFTMPEEVEVGTTARIRIVYQNAWLGLGEDPTESTPNPNATNLNKGIAYDIVVNAVAVPAPTTHTITVVAPEGVELGLANADTQETLEANEDGTYTVAEGTTLVLGLIADTEGKVVTVTYGDETLEASEEGYYTFTVSADATLTITIEDAPVPTYAVTFAEAENGTFTVMNGETALTSGDEVEENTELTVNATPADGYELGAITVNGNALTGNTFTVTEATTIAVTFNKVVTPVTPNMGIMKTMPDSYGKSSKTDTRVLIPYEAINHGSYIAANENTDVDFTVAAWFKPTAVNTQANLKINSSVGVNHGVILALHTPDHMYLDGHWYLAIDPSGNLRMVSNGAKDNQVGTPGFDRNSPASCGTAALNEMHYFTVSVDNTNKKLYVYVDGELTGDITLTNALTYKWRDAKFELADIGVSGLLDQADFFNKALTADEVKAAMNNAAAVDGVASIFTFDAVKDGTTGTFVNTVAGGPEVEAVYQSYTGGRWEDANGLLEGSATETAPTLVEGREITVAPATCTLTVVANGVDYVLANAVTTDSYEGTEITVEEGTEMILGITEVPEGKVLTAVKLNDTELEGETTYEFTVTENATLEMVVEDAPVTTYAVTIAETDATVTANVEDLTAVEEGTDVIFTITAPEGKQIASVSYNDEALTANENGTYTITVTADGTLTVVTEDIPVVETGKSILIPASGNGSGTNVYSLRFDDVVLGSHTNGTNDDTDLRSRNFTYSTWVKIKEANATETSIMGNIQKEFACATGAFRVFYKDGKLQLNGRDLQADFVNVVGTATTDEGTALNEWVYISVVADQEAQTVTLYKNCKPISSFTTTNGIGLLPDESMFFVNEQGASVQFAEAQLWNKALTLDELKDSYNLTETPEALVAYFKAGEMVEGSTTDLRNLGSEGTTVANLYGGRYSLINGWLPKYSYSLQDIETLDEERELATVNVTLVQPTEEGCSFTAVAADGSDLAENPVLFSKFTVLPTLAEGYSVKNVVVECNGETTKYALDEMPARFNGDATVSLELFDGMYNITFTGEHGKMQYQGFVGMEDIPAEGVKMEAGYNVFVKVVPDEGYLLESITLNGTDVTEQFNNNEYTIQAISSDCAFEAVFTEDLSNTALITLITPTDSEVEAENVRGILTDNVMTPYELDENNSVRVNRGTGIYLLIYDGQEMANGDKYQFATCTINEEQINPTFAGAFYLYRFDANEDKVITITQSLLSGINGIAADNNGELSFANGIVNVPADAELSIVAVNGQVLRTAKGSINVSDLNSGIYLAVAKIDGKVYTLKFMK